MTTEPKIVPETGQHPWNERAVERQSAPRTDLNVGSNERTVSALVGGGLTLYGLGRRDGFGTALALLGGALVYRGVAGYDPVYAAAGVTTAKAGPGLSGPIKIERSVTINKPAEEIYAFWRNFENLPRFMTHLESVTVQDDKHSHWVVKAPLGTTVEWDAEIFVEKPNELIGWRSVGNPDIENAGTVRFTPAPGGRGTELKATINYNAPGGKLGSFIAWLLGEEPSKQTADDLRRFKQLMEAGAITTVDGQPSGRSK